MKHAVRIAVLSDQHIDTKVDPDSWELGKRAFRAAARAKVDHVVLAGDTFDCSTAMVRDRAVVERYLRRLGLWHRDRLTIVVGNHDIFHVPHRGTWSQRAAEFIKIATEDAQDSYDAFIAWAGQLAHPADRLAGDDDLYPLDKHLGHVRLWAVDTTAATTDLSGNGYWSAEADHLLRSADAGIDGEHRILAIHHPPFKDEEQTIPRILKGDFSFGFPAGEYRRLKQFVVDARVEQILCGHIHAGMNRWHWTVGGKKSRAHVRVLGRTGGVHGSTPCFGVLEVPERGASSWSEIQI